MVVSNKDTNHERPARRCERSYDITRSLLDVSATSRLLGGWDMPFPRLTLKRIARVTCRQRSQSIDSYYALETSRLYGHRCRWIVLSRRLFAHRTTPGARRGRKAC